MATTRKKTAKRKTGKTSTKKKSTSAKKGGKKKNMSPLNRPSEDAESASETRNSSAKKSASEKVTDATTSVAREAMEKLEKLQAEVASPTRESSAKRSQSGTGNNPTPPEERDPAQAGTQQTAAADMAAGAISAARDHLVRQEEAERRLKSDPRYERDQEIFKKGQEGKLGLVPPSEAETAVANERAGISPEVSSKIPHNVEEQVADDKKRLAAADEKSKSLSKAADNTSHSR